MVTILSVFSKRKILHLFWIIVSVEGSDIGSGFGPMVIAGVLDIGGIDFFLELCSPLLSLLRGHNHSLTSLVASCYLCGAYICVKNRKLRFLFHFIINDLGFLF